MLLGGALSAGGLGASRAPGLARVQCAPRTGEGFQVRLDSSTCGVARAGGAWALRTCRPRCVRRILSGEGCASSGCAGPRLETVQPGAYTEIQRTGVASSIVPAGGCGGAVGRGLKSGTPSGGDASWESGRCCWAARRWPGGCAVMLLVLGTWPLRVMIEIPDTAAKGKAVALNPAVL